MRKLFILANLLFMGQMMHATNTDVSDIPNVIYISPFSAAAGSQVSVSIEMKNVVAIRGFQFDLYLPNGVTAVKSDKGRIQGSLSEGRLPDEDEHDLTFSEQEDGAIRFLCSSQYDETFTGTNGEIATLQVRIAGDMAIGDYPILLKNVKLTETDISYFYLTELVETTITITEPADTRTVLDENSTTVPASAANVDVRVKRTINANEWSTICLPFAMTEVQVKEAFGDDVQLADFIGTNPEYDENDNVVAITANFTEAQAIEANYPYIIKVSTAVTEFTVDGVDIVADEDEAYIEFDNGKTGSRRVVYSGFYGTYHAQTVLDEFTLFLSDNKFWYSTGLTKMKAFRAYFEFLDILTEVEEANGIKIWVGDDATGIESIDHSSLTIDHRYNLAGQRVGKDYKGIVIENGKKIIK